MKSSAFWRQVKIEFEDMIFNPGILIIFALAPLFYGIFYAYPYSREIPRGVPIAIVDEDNTQMSRKLSQMIGDTQYTTVTTVLPAFREAQNLFYERKIYAIAIIPQGFQKKVLKGEQADIALYADGSYLLYYRQAYTGTQLAAATLAAGIKIKKLAASGIPEKTAALQRTSVVLDNQALYNPISGYATYVLPTVFILICHQLMLITLATTMGYQRHDPTYYSRTLQTRTSVTPLTRLGAKTFTSTVILFFQSLLFFGIVLPFFKIPFNGHLADLILFLCPFFLAVIFLGIILGSFVKTPETVILYLAATSMPLLFLSGVPWAVAAMPLPIKLLHEVLPSSHALNGFVRIYRESATLSEVIPSVRALWIIALILFFIAFYRLKKVEIRDRKI